jgi:competence protein ComEC
LGVKQLDLLVLSHYHSDHSGGLEAVVRHFDVKAVVGPIYFDDDTARVQRILAQHGVELLNPQIENSGTLGQGVRGEVVWQLHNVNSQQDDANENSLALEVLVATEYGPLRLVALGDLEVTGQNTVLAQMRAAALGSAQGDTPPVDIVKVAHHGSAKQSPALARYLAPQVAVYSVGAGNSYGHPNSKALQLFAGTGATNLRTDECGLTLLAKREAGLVYTCSK